MWRQSSRQPVHLARYVIDSNVLPLVTETLPVAEAARRAIMSLHGISKDAWKRQTAAGYQHWDILAPGFKYNMSDLQAALLGAQFLHIEEFWQRRRNLTLRFRQGLADTGRMAPNEIELQLATLLGRDAHVRELPETGIHAVHRFSALDRGFDGPARLLHSLERLRIEGNGHPVPRYSNDISDRKRLPVQRDSGGLRHGPKR